MNWFARHPNWTLFLSYLAAYPLAFVSILFFYFLFQPSSDEGLIMAEVLAWFLVIGFLLFVAAWASKKKGRSAAWCLLHFVPFGAFILLGLENKTGITKTDNEAKDYFVNKPTQCPYCGAKNTNEFVVRKANNEVEKAKLGYSYLWEGHCYNCQRKWRFTESEEAEYKKTVETIPLNTNSNPAFCSKCGNKLTPDMSFCSRCGRKLD